jgi:hypothetical protein
MIGKRSHNGALYDGNPRDFPPILTKNVWHAVKAVLEDPSRRTTMRAGVPAHLLTGLCFCGVCERPMRARMMTGKTKTPYRVYYCCSPNTRGAYHVARHADSVDDLIIEAVFAAVENEDFNDAANGLRSNDPTKPFYARLAELQALKDATGRKLREAEAREDAGLPAKSGRSVADYESDLAGYEKEEESCWASIERLKDGRVRAHLPRNLRELWPSYSLDRQRAILRAWIDRIDVHPQSGRVFDPDAVHLIPKHWA